MERVIRLLRLLAWRLEGKPKTTALPIRIRHPFRDLDGYKLVGYEEFPLNEVGEVYLDEFDNKYQSVRRRIYLFDTCGDKVVYKDAIK